MDEIAKAVFRRYDSLCGICFRNVFEQQKIIKKLWSYVFRSNRLEREARYRETEAPFFETWFTPKGTFHEAVFFSMALSQASFEYPYLMKYDEDRDLYIPKYRRGFLITQVKPESEGGIRELKNCRLLCIFCWAKLEEEKTNEK